MLIAPLNWGLGHATRCLPLAAALRARGAAVHWASDGAAAELLRRERPGDVHLRLPGYGVRHASRSAVVNGLRAAPRLLVGVRAEAAATVGLQHVHQYDYILSDHRYGCRVEGVRGGILCHQVHLPIGHRLARAVSNGVHQRLLWRFGEVLVPDYAPPQGLAGEMSGPLEGQSMRYLGPLSRFRRSSPRSHGGAGLTSEAPRRGATRRLAVVLSGPEPARSGFEARVLRQLSAGPWAARATVVRGLPLGGPSNAALVEAARAAGTKIHEFLGTSALGEVLATADQLLLRPGYTTVMDVAALGRRALFVPTPGQPEQQVLAKALATGGRGVWVRERSLDLDRDLRKLAALDDAALPVSGDASGALEAWADEVAQAIC